jgi:hypothetical protein
MVSTLIFTIRASSREAVSAGNVLGFGHCINLHLRWMALFHGFSLTPFRWFGGAKCPHVVVSGYCLFSCCESLFSFIRLFSHLFLISIRRVNH